MTKKCGTHTLLLWQTMWRPHLVSTSPSAETPNTQIFENAKENNRPTKTIQQRSQPTCPTSFRASLNHQKATKIRRTMSRCEKSCRISLSPHAAKREAVRTHALNARRFPKLTAVVSVVWQGKVHQCTDAADHLALLRTSARWQSCSPLFAPLSSLARSLPPPSPFPRRRRRCCRRRCCHSRDVAPPTPSHFSPRRHRRIHRQEHEELHYFSPAPLAKSAPGVLDVPAQPI